LGYIGWKDFVEKNSRYSVRTIQRRLNEVNGVREYTKTEQTTNVVLPESTPENDSELAAILDVKPTAPVHRGRSKAQVAADASCAQKMMEHCGTGPVSSDTARLRKEFSGTGLELKTSTHGGRYDLCGLLPAQLKMIAPFLRDPAGWKKILRQITNGNI
jgi:hypothetical protein